MRVQLKSEPFLRAVEARHSNYTLTSQSTISPPHLRQIIDRSMMATPTSFNMQHLKAVVLTGKNHTNLWSALLDEKLRLEKDSERSEERKEQWRKRYAGHLGAQGSIVFMEDQGMIDGCIERNPNGKNEIPLFASHSSGILQHIIWTALTDEGLGASLQHPATHDNQRDQDIVRKLTKLEDKPNWRVTAVMVFGKPSQPPRLKDRIPVTEKVRYMLDEDLEGDDGVEHPVNL